MASIATEMPYREPISISNETSHGRNKQDSTFQRSLEAIEAAAAKAAAPPTPGQLSMSYHDNKVNMKFSAGDGYILLAGRYQVTDLSISDGQDPDGKNKIGDQKYWTQNDDWISWEVGRHKTSQVANWWKGKIQARQSTFNHNPDELNFAFLGYMRLQISGGILGQNVDEYTIPGVAIGQGSSGSTNDWWFGGQSDQNVGDDTVRLSGTSISGYTVNFYFKRGGSGNNVDEIDLNRVEYPEYRMFPLGTKYIGESVRDVWQSSAGGAGKLPPFVTYYTNAQVNLVRLTVKEGGLLYTSNGLLFDTRGADLSHSQVPVAIFVVDRNSNVYASNQFKVFMFHHSTLLAGADVASAGELQAVGGRITFMSNLSGHYRPDAPTAHLQLSEALYRQGYHETVPQPYADFSRLLY